MTFCKEIRIRNRVITENMEEPYIIAEMACAHDGEVAKAKKLVDSAVSAGADAIQFEVLSPDDNIVPQEEVYDLITRINFTREQWKEIYEYARGYGIAISTFGYDHPSLKLGIELGSDILKLNSSDLSNPDMIIDCARSGLPFTVGTGSSTFQEISKSLKLALENGGKKIILMHGLQNFPTDLKNAHIRRMIILKNAFGCLAGSADHTDASTDLSKIIDLVAVGMGASVLEKHITIDRSERGVDYEAALEPDEFKKYVELMKNSYTALGPARILPFKENDLEYRRFQKKSIVASKDIDVDEVFSSENLCFLRNPKTAGISPMEHERIEGKRAKRPVKKFDQILPGDIVGGFRSIL